MSETLKKKEKIALVTGGGTGIGASCARYLANAGYTAAIHFNKSEGPAVSLSRELPGAFTVQGDLSTIAGCDQVYDALRRSDMPLEVVVNNAGLVQDSPIFSATADEFQATMELNMRATWYLTKKLVRLLIRNGSGRIVNISSVSARLANPGQSVYAMTKAAVEAFTRVAAVEFAQNGILVNAVAPGFVETQMTDALNEEQRARILEMVPLRRMGRPEEVAEAVCFLATSGSYVTGTTLHVNGGLYAN